MLLPLLVTIVVVVVVIKNGKWLVNVLVTKGRSRELFVGLAKQANHCGGHVDGRGDLSSLQICDQCLHHLLSHRYLPNRSQKPQILIWHFL